MDSFKAVDTLKNALTIMGVDSSLISDVDHHSTIELNFNDRPSIMFSTTEDTVFIWSILGEYNLQVLLNGAANIIEPLIKHHDWMVANQLQLLEHDGDFVLRALLSQHVVEQDDLLADALSQFFDYTAEFNQVLK